MKFLKVLEANLPETVTDDSIIFTETGKIFVNDSSGELVQMGGTGGGGTGGNPVYGYLSQLIVPVDPTTVVAKGDYLNNNEDYPGVYVVSNDPLCTTFVMPIPEGMDAVIVNKDIVTARFIVSTFPAEPTNNMTPIAYVKNNAATRITMGNIDSTAKYLAVYVTNAGDDVSVNITFIARDVSPQPIPITSQGVAVINKLPTGELTPGTTYILNRTPPKMVTYVNGAWWQIPMTTYIEE